MIKRHKIVFYCGKALLILGVPSGGVPQKIDQKVTMASVSFLTDSSSDVLEFIS